MDTQAIVHGRGEERTKVYVVNSEIKAKGGGG
jgi:hypothetical protein